MAEVKWNGRLESVHDTDHGPVRWRVFAFGREVTRARLVRELNTHRPSTFHSHGNELWLAKGGRGDFTVKYLPANTNAQANMNEPHSRYVLASDRAEQTWSGTLACPMSSSEGHQRAIAWGLFSFGGRVLRVESATDAGEVLKFEGENVWVRAGQVATCVVTYVAPPLEPWKAFQPEQQFKFVGDATPARLMCGLRTIGAGLLAAGAVGLVVGSIGVAVLNQQRAHDEREDLADQMSQLSTDQARRGHRQGPQAPAAEHGRGAASPADVGTAAAAGSAQVREAEAAAARAEEAARAREEREAAAADSAAATAAPTTAAAAATADAAAAASRAEHLRHVQAEAAATVRQREAEVAAAEAASRREAAEAAAAQAEARRVLEVQAAAEAAAWQQQAEAAAADATRRREAAAAEAAAQQEAAALAEAALRRRDNDAAEAEADSVRSRQAAHVQLQAQLAHAEAEAARIRYRAAENAYIDAMLYPQRAPRATVSYQYSGGASGRSQQCCQILKNGARCRNHITATAHGNCRYCHVHRR